MTQTNINTAFIRIIRHYRNTPFTRFQFLVSPRAAITCSSFSVNQVPTGTLLLNHLSPSKPRWHQPLLHAPFQLFCLTGYIIPLTSTHSIHIRSDIQPFFQKSQYFLCYLHNNWDQLSSLLYNQPFSIPWMPDITFIT